MACSITQAKVVYLLEVQRVALQSAHGKECLGREYKYLLFRFQSAYLLHTAVVVGAAYTQRLLQVLLVGVEEFAEPIDMLI